jgi:hemoglobin-like flavoprotein
MNLTPRQISLVQGSFRKLNPIARTFAELFYMRLFAIEPALEPALHALFRNGRDNDGENGRADCLMRLMGTLVSNLNKLDCLKRAVAALGRSALGRALTPSAYDAAGQALIWTLARGLEDELTDEAKLAWLDAYSLLAEFMAASAGGVAASAHGATA